MTFGLDHDEIGFYEAECRGREIFTQVDEAGLCKECVAKLERDLIRQRDWDYSTVSYGVPPEKREELRKKVIRQFGKDLELIAPYEVKKSNSRVRKRGKKKRS